MGDRDALHPAIATGTPLAGPSDPSLPFPSPSASPTPSEHDASFTTVDLLVPSDSATVDLVNVDLASPSHSLTHSLGTPRGLQGYTPGFGAPPLGGVAPPGVPLVPHATAVNAESLLAQAQGVDADVLELQEALMRVSAAVEEARGIADRGELEELANSVKRELELAILLVRRTIKGHVAAMQQETAASLKVPGCGVGTPTFHMRQTVANAVKNKLRRRRDNTLDLESRLNMGIRDTAKRRYYDVIGSAPSDDLVDRLCSPAPPECKLGTLTRREAPLDDRMTNLLKEMEVRTAMAIDTSKKLSSLERELTFVVDILEHEESALKYELDVEKRNRRGMAVCICLGLLVFVLVVFIIPGVAVYLP